MSSHDLGEIERLAELVAIVRAGRLVAEETVSGLKRRQRRRAQVTFDGEIPVAALRALPGVVDVEANHRVATVLTEPDINPLIAFLAAAKPQNVVLSPPSLDDIFMEFYDRSDQRATVS